MKKINHIWLGESRRQNAKKNASGSCNCTSNALVGIHGLHGISVIDQNVNVGHLPTGVVCS